MSLKVGLGTLASASLVCGSTPMAHRVYSQGVRVISAGLHDLLRSLSGSM